MYRCENGCINMVMVHMCENGCIDVLIDKWVLMDGCMSKWFL